ncbi:MAG: bifunctional phosphoribosyl-AMP cyclohydrolase/phosphoribosyl-ATP diphosphatase HisIE [Eubacterium sp.]|nr:bifunctional phosphoribosyl-AMP cyclohydrolase/phosphoribosyl-ATP diphosphatase HisIE [Eubacterium sp.]
MVKLYSKIVLDNGNVKGSDKSPVSQAMELKNKGADGVYLVDKSTSDAEHDANISAMIEIKNNLDIDFVVDGTVNRLEDIKKYFYAGASLIVKDEIDSDVLEEGEKRFGVERFVTASDILEYTYSDDTDFIATKKELKAEGKDVCIFEAEISFDELKTNDQGLVPVVVQDYKTDKVLMLAYMNKEAFENTVESGMMTYYSRSRDEQWVKGETSGNFQYVKELTADCDKDTLLAKVYQVGVACHTGAESCFFNEVIKADVDTTNPMKVFEDVYNIILDRKENPKEGSYTNYLFDKGIDKILKKVGEEATEIVIAAKNPDSQEMKYEISDFLYHVMVLMAERGVTWEDITEELSRR